MMSIVSLISCYVTTGSARLIMVNRSWLVRTEKRLGIGHQLSLKNVEKGEEFQEISPDEIDITRSSEKIRLGILKRSQLLSRWIALKWRDLLVLWVLYVTLVFQVYSLLDGSWVSWFLRVLMNVMKSKEYWGFNEARLSNQDWSRKFLLSIIISLIKDARERTSEKENEKEKETDFLFDRCPFQFCHDQSWRMSIELVLADFISENICLDQLGQLTPES